jgi:hypothetical protein
MESLRSRRAPEKPWLENDELFLSELKEGRRYEELVAELLGQRGIPASVPPLKVRGSISEASRFADQADVVVEGVGNIEVKSRRVRFTRPSDIPPNLMPFFVTTLASWEGCETKPLAIVVISREVATSGASSGDGIVVIPRSTSDKWEVLNRHDNVRGIDERFLAAPKSCLRSFNALVNHLLEKTSNTTANATANATAGVVPLKPRAKLDSPCAHLYPYLSKGWPPDAGKENAVRVFWQGRWRLATLMKAHSYEDGCQVVLMGEKETVKNDKKHSPVMRTVNWTEVRSANA